MKTLLILTSALRLDKWRVGNLNFLDRKLTTMRLLTEEERCLLDKIEYSPVRGFWFKLMIWDIFRPKRRDKFLHNLKMGMNVKSAYKFSK